jgi:hypothetical protein
MKFEKHADPNAKECVGEKTNSYHIKGLIRLENLWQTDGPEFDGCNQNGDGLPRKNNRGTGKLR